jgi:hypothetical protein
MPAGIATWSVRSSRTRPSPPHSVHGLDTIRPSPRHRLQATMFTICPRIVCATRRFSPLPLHSGHVSGSVPGSPPEPSQRVQAASVGKAISFVTPKTASANSMVRS